MLQVAAVTGISTDWFENFQRFELWRVIFPGSFPTEVENWFKFDGVSNNRGFEKSGVKLQCYSEANPRETTTGSSLREVRETKGSKNRDSTEYCGSIFTDFFFVAVYGYV